MMRLNDIRFQDTDGKVERRVIFRNKGKGVRWTNNAVKVDLLGDEVEDNGKRIVFNKVSRVPGIATAYLLEAGGHTHEVILHFDCAEVWRGVNRLNINVMVVMVAKFAVLQVYSPLPGFYEEFTNYLLLIDDEIYPISATDLNLLKTVVKENNNDYGFVRRLLKIAMYRVADPKKDTSWLKHLKTRSPTPLVS